MEAQRIKAAPARRNAGADFECSAKIKNKKIIDRDGPFFFLSIKTPERLTLSAPHFLFDNEMQLYHNSFFIFLISDAGEDFEHSSLMFFNVLNSSIVFQNVF